MAGTSGTRWLIFTRDKWADAGTGERKNDAVREVVPGRKNGGKDGSWYKRRLSRSCHRGCPRAQRIAGKGLEGCLGQGDNFFQSDQYLIGPDGGLIKKFMNINARARGKLSQGWGLSIAGAADSVQKIVPDCTCLSLFGRLKV